MSVLDDPVALARQASAFTVADIIGSSAVRFADRPALVSAELRYTYCELDERSTRLAHALRALGLGHRDRLAVLSETRPEYVEIYLAAAKLGVTVVALGTRLTPKELAHCVELAAPRLLLASPGFAEIAGELLEQAPSVEQLIELPSNGGDAASEYERALAEHSALPLLTPAEPEDIHCVLFTSGTTGLPKGAMISHRASVMRAFRVVDWFGLTADDGLIGWIPMFHTGGDECVQATLLSGGVFATFPRADPELLFAGIERDRLTWTPMLPGLITDFLHHPARSRYDLSSLRFTLGYANMMPRTVREFTLATDSAFWDAYGQTESSFVVALDRVDPGQEPSLRKRAAPLLGVRLVDEKMRDVPIGKPGECVVRGPTVMSGYLGDPAATADAFRGGWLHTGDLLLRHEDGTMSYVDRLKYLIKTGGENVYPSEVEQVLTAHETVREACVVSVPDPRWGETVKAVLVLEPGADPDPEALRSWCRDRLAGFKCPRYMQFLAEEDVPRSTTGKILRHELEYVDAASVHVDAAGVRQV